MRLSVPCLVLLASCALPLGAQQPADTARTDTTRARRLAPFVVRGARLAIETDPRLPSRATPLELPRATHGAAALSELLLRTPGVSVANDQGSRAQPTLEVRGFTLSPVVGVAQGISVFLDGVRVNEADAQEVNFDLLPLEVVDRAELVSGATAVYGKNSLGGSLVLRTIRGDGTPRVSGGLELGSFGERDAHVIAAGLARGIDGMVLLKGTTEDGYQAESGALTRQLFATVGRRAATGDLALSVLVARDRLSQAGSLPERWLGPARRANYTGGDFFRPALVHLTLRGERVLDAATVRGNLFSRGTAIEQLNVNAGGANTRAFVTNRVSGGTVELSLPVMLGSRALALSLGGEASRARVDYRVLAESNREAPGLPDECDPFADGASALCEDALARGDELAAYAQALLEVTPELSMLVSARGDLSRVPFEDRRDADNDGTSTFRRISPKLGATWVHAGVRAFASIGTAFRAPAALELACASPDATCPLPFSLGADPPLNPVVVWSYETGVSWTPSAGTSLALSLYHTDVRDEIVFVSPERAAGYFQNVARTRREGLESSAAWELPAGMRTFGSYSYVAATYRSRAVLASALDDNDVVPGSSFAGSPRHRATAGVGITRVGMRASFDAELLVRAVSSSFLRGDEANRMPPLPGYATGDLRLSVRRDRLAASVSVANLLDRRYELFGVYAPNPKGGYGEAPPATPAVERFVTPAYPRTIRLSVSVEP